ncbi:GTP-binding protein [Arthrobacter sp. RIT-PI-e]|uniref:dynamin family protein n=1 Tax=Arthrobacter sp. RIT-PI-e TaxID=1681197 RepID=UPI000676461C|nr:dynamin family protein [Arthrobacter sp. RIT-PI-e]KNC19836.1 GTP-binding protein [Arthrobacter sp. RIT-PI-e]
MSGTGEAVATLGQDALAVYADDPQVSAELETYAVRLREPLRVALAGMVKAGKSTLLNAIIGEEIAPTDTGECTRIVTWYRWAATPRITLHPLEGEPVLLPVRRVDGRLQFELGSVRAEEVRRLVVDWPAERLRHLTLIDTPGIASLSSDVSERSLAFLTPEDAPSEADAVVYLMRHLHASDLDFLEAFRDTSAGTSGTVNALAVLSRADEVGAGRIDSLISAGSIADRYRADPSLRALALEVVPIAGLLAQTARTLRQEEYHALALLAAVDRTAREGLLLSADRFVRIEFSPDVGQEARAALLERFGLFGIRLACALLQGSVHTASDLARELARRSGLDQLLLLMGQQFQERAAQLRARTALTGVEALVRSHPRDGSTGLLTSVEKIHTGAHEIRELRLLSALRSRTVPLAPAQAAEVERLIGGSGVAQGVRLGLDDGASPDDVRAAALAHLYRWRGITENPLTPRTAAEACAVVVRTCEELVQEAQVRAHA